MLKLPHHIALSNYPGDCDRRSFTRELLRQCTRTKLRSASVEELPELHFQGLRKLLNDPYGRIAGAALQITYVGAMKVSFLGISGYPLISSLYTPLGVLRRDPLTGC